jgi:beta-galactosidase
VAGDRQEAGSTSALWGKIAHFVRQLVVALSLVGISVSAFSQQATAAHPKWPGPGHLFVGACYQPIDRSPQEIDHDIAIMKRAGFNVVRMGDWSWDSL